jgi:hypothetical protein
MAVLLPLPQYIAGMEMHQSQEPRGLAVFGGVGVKPATAASDQADGIAAAHAAQEDEVRGARERGGGGR